MASYSDIVDSVRKCQFSPLYLLAGEEPFYIDELATLLETHVVPVDEWDFNRVILYGDKTSVADIANEARRFPMMGRRQLIVVREAQLVDNIDLLEAHYGTFPDTTILVIAYKKKPEKRKACHTKAEKFGKVFVSETIPDYKMPDFILSAAAGKKLSVSPEVAYMLADYLGNDLEKLMNELDKLILITQDSRGVVTSEIVEQHIGVSKSFNNFELLRAIVNRETGKTFRIAHYFARNEKEHPIQATLPVLFNYFSNLMIVCYLPQKNPDAIMKALSIRNFQVRDYMTGLKMYSTRKVFDIIHEIRMTDARSKGVDTTGTFAGSGDLLRELLHFIFH